MTTPSPRLDGGHTAGPWVATERSGYHEILAPDDGCDWYGHPKMHAVAYCDTEIDESEQAANARLIAAAPDMLAALQHILGGALSLPRFAEVEARAAITKATGSKS